MWVVKLGGSLAQSSQLREWLSVLQDCRGMSLVVVPGGGAFADLVRDFSISHQLSESCGHRMALYAMQQYALMLADLAPVLQPVEKLEEIPASMALNRIPLFLPAACVIGNTELAESWRVTSDSIAAWLASTIGASDLLLVKSVHPESSSSRLDSLVGASIIDPSFAEYLSARTNGWWCGPSASHAFLSLGKGSMTASQCFSRIHK